VLVHEELFQDNLLDFLHFIVFQDVLFQMLVHCHARLNRKLMRGLLRKGISLADVYMDFEGLRLRLGTLQRCVEIKSLAHQ
jgi:hypothetical protein